MGDTHFTEYHKEVKWLVLQGHIANNAKAELSHYVSMISSQIVTFQMVLEESYLSIKFICMENPEEVMWPST